MTINGKITIKTLATSNEFFKRGTMKLRWENYMGQNGTSPKPLRNLG
jgi:hypothetical protein